MGRRSGCWSDAVCNGRAQTAAAGSPYRIGVLPGEGIGPEVIGCALRVLSALESVSAHRFEIITGGTIGHPAEIECGSALSPEVIEFCRSLFAAGGAVLAGPGGGRFVYDLRKQFDLFCKITPLRVFDELLDAGRMKPDHVRAVDILVVRENVGGIYQGQWDEVSLPWVGRRAEHRFAYSEGEVQRILTVAARLARARRGEMTVVYKDAGIPTVSRLWSDCAGTVASAHGIKVSLLDVDHAAYRLLQHAPELDLLVTSNLFGDILSDLGAVLLGSRGLTYSGNFATDGAAVYQTNHGAAYDLVGTNRANPAGQILSLAMLLRESFGLLREAEWIEAAVAHVWREGWRTPDLAEEGCRVLGTREMGDRCARALIDWRECPEPHEPSTSADRLPK